MRTVFTTTLALAAGLCSLALSGQARAQNWDSYVDTAPAAAQPAAPASSNWEYTLGAGAGYAGVDVMSITCWTIAAVIIRVHPGCVLGQRPDDIRRYEFDPDGNLIREPS